MDKIVTCVLILGLFGIAQGLDISGSFVENFGWKIHCGWTKESPNNTFQRISVNRNHNEALFVYEPAINGATYNTSIVHSDSITNISCLQEVGANGGNCVITVEVKGPPKDDTYTAVVDWQSPFLKQETSIETIIGKASSPKIAVIKNAGQRDSLNCSSSGVPAPVFVWTLEKDNTEVPADTNDTFWNTTTKLYDSWSVFKPTNQSNLAFRVVCTPRQVNRKGEVIIGHSQSGLINSANQFGASVISAAVLLALAFNTYSGSL